ncbi:MULTISPECIES: DUF7144 family membrane protein [unclassified Blastococcus]
MSTANSSGYGVDWRAGERGGLRGDTDRPTGWASWIVFAAVMLVIIGFFALVEGLSALVNDDFFPVRSEALLLDLGYTTWGWVHVVLGALAIVVGAGLMRGHRAALIAGVVFAGVNAVVHLAFLPAFPFWSALIIAFDVIVIYAITVHGSEVAASA